MGRKCLSGRDLDLAFSVGKMGTSGEEFGVISSNLYLSLNMKFRKLTILGLWFHPRMEGELWVQTVVSTDSRKSVNP